MLSGLGKSKSFRKGEKMAVLGWVCDRGAGGKYKSKTRMGNLGERKEKKSGTKIYGGGESCVI